MLGQVIINALIHIYKENILIKDVPTALVLLLLNGELKRTVELTLGQLIINVQVTGLKDKNIYKDVPMILVMILING